MIYVYAVITGIDANVLPVSGMEDGPVVLRRFGELTIAFSEHERAPVATAPENLLRHEQVVERFMSADSLLPARFGTLFESDAALGECVARNRVALLEGLDRVRGCVEMGVRVFWTQAADPPRDASRPATGREYLLRRAEDEHDRRRKEQEAHQLAEVLHAPLSAAAVQSTCRVLVAPQLPLSGAYLIRRERMDEFRRTVQALASAHPGLRMLCTGPWPCYHFAPAIDAPEACRV